ncbi:Zn-ribbon domain-containing OB-fold protein [Jiangella alba]|uniref:DUF35 domain-containing protein n=1 Tax=Jiangella alba TaxID=561176 RepID=A0A1H5K2D3_9ACTN|nr:OB-fold domain-containing protein [Jiangella alba]SEE58168.1 hypothetical protein SAMN04488561_1832 [Jiangella alba]
MTPQAPSRPLPRNPHLDTLPFWAAAAEHRLTYQRCRACDTVIFYPRGHCTTCTGTDLGWHESAGAGTVYTCSVVRRPLHPAFKDLAPYTVAWVDLDEGFRLLTHIVDRAGRPVTSYIGQRVTVHWLDVDGVALPAFTPAADRTEDR